MRFDLLRATLSAPVTVTWEITRNCNLRCTHCLSGSGVGPATPLERAKNTADELADLGVFQVDIGGGEPFLHPDIFPILEHCVGRGLVTCLSTNGTLLSEDGARRLADLGVRVQISLDGATEDVNDRVRGRGSFCGALRGLELLSRHSMRLAVNVVLTGRNCDQLDESYALARNAGAELRVSRFRPSGRGTEAWRELRPRREQLLWLRDWLDGHPEVLTGDSFFFLETNGRREGSLKGCGAGSLTCCISPEGDVYPCAFLQWDPFLCGNLGEASFATIWTASPVLASMRGGLSTCSGCTQAAGCSRGCPAVSYGAGGSIADPDPDCITRLSPEAATED